MIYSAQTMLYNKRLNGLKPHLLSLINSSKSANFHVQNNSLQYPHVCHESDIDKIEENIKLSYNVQEEMKQAKRDMKGKSDDIKVPSIVGIDDEAFLSQQGNPLQPNEPTTAKTFSETKRSVSTDEE